MLKRIASITLSTLAAAGMTAGSASAHDAAGGSKSCPAGKQVSIVSRGSGIITHSWSEGPEHLGYPVYRIHFPGQLQASRYTKTSMRFAYWNVLAEDGEFAGGQLNEAYAVCEAP